MSYLTDAAITAASLIVRLDSEVLETVSTSLSVSAIAILIAAVFGVPIGLAVGLGRFPGRKTLSTLLSTLMALPTVVIGLVVYGLISRQGPLGSFGLLFTPAAMVIGQVILATPIIAHYTLAAVEGADPRILPTLRTLGGGPLTCLVTLTGEIRHGIYAALVAGFGRIIAEVGVAMMLGGNIRHSTRTMTTAIALETSKGEFAFALALGMVLLTVALIVNMLVGFWQQEKG